LGDVAREANDKGILSFQVNPAMKPVARILALALVLSLSTVASGVAQTPAQDQYGTSAPPASSSSGPEQGAAQSQAAPGASGAAGSASGSGGRGEAGEAGERGGSDRGRADDRDTGAGDVAGVSDDEGAAAEASPGATTALERGRMPFTGGEVAVLVAIGLGLVAAGLLLRIAQRRPRRSASIARRSS
jgi:hypothetical protein